MLRGRSEATKVLNLVEKHPDLFTFHGEIHDNYKLLQLYRNCDVFFMPSKQEAFELVFAEAILLGIPILYTKNEGIDGTYQEKIGEAVTTGDMTDIKEKLLLLYNEYDSYEMDIPLLKRNHDWKLIAQNYVALYASILPNKLKKLISYALDLTY